MTRAVDIHIPDLGDFKNIPVLEILVSPGSRVEVDTPLITLESDKAVLEIPAPSSGTVESLAIRPGAKVSQGDLILKLLPDLKSEAPAAPESLTPWVPQRLLKRSEPEQPPSSASTPAPSASAVAPATASDRIYAGPAARALCRLLDIDPATVNGTGPRGRITKEDVQRHFKQADTAEVSVPARAPAPIPSIDFSRFGPIDRQPLSRIQKIAGAHLARSWSTIPHVTNFDEADITDLEAFRVAANADQNVKLTLLAFLMKACALTLARFPAFNASLDGDALILKRYCHIGFAVDTPQGLLVPVVQNVVSKGLITIASELLELSQQARGGKLKRAAMEGGCFSISSLGSIGGVGFTPIINAPEVAILGVSRASLLPRWQNDRAVPRLILPLSLSWDHRAVDGAAAGRFLSYLCGLLGDLRRWAL